MRRLGMSLVALAIVAGAALVLGSRGTRSAVADDAAPGASIRCERLGGMGVKDLKAKLVENCNLDKPFSIAGMDSSLNASYTYCCHLK